MRKAFLVVFEKEMTTPIQRKTFHEKLTTDQNIFGWWHYMNNSYIVIASDNVTASSIRKFVQSLLPNVNHFALQIKYGDYDGYLDKKAWDWIENTLKPATKNTGMGF